MSKPSLMVSTVVLMGALMLAGAGCAGSSTTSVASPGSQNQQPATNQPSGSTAGTNTGATNNSGATAMTNAACELVPPSLLKTTLGLNVTIKEAKGSATGGTTCLYSGAGSLNLQYSGSANLYYQPSMWQGMSGVVMVTDIGDKGLYQVNGANINIQLVKGDKFVYLNGYLNNSVTAAQARAFMTAVAAKL